MKIRSLDVSRKCLEKKVVCKHVVRLSLVALVFWLKIKDFNQKFFMSDSVFMSVKT